MNLLPFVIIIILISGMFTQSQLQQTISIKKEECAFRAYFLGHRESRNLAESNSYLNAIKKNPAPAKSVSTFPSKNTYPFVRNHMISWPIGRLNLSSLLSDKKNEDHINLAISYFKSIYAHKHFFPENPKAFLLLLFDKVVIEEIPIQAIRFENPKMQESIYKILRGTQTYDIMLKKGYPPFAHFFSFEKSNQKPMNFHAANTLFLKAALGEKITNNILNKEQKNKSCNSLKSPITKKDLIEILGSDASTKIDLFKFTVPTIERSNQSHIDEKTQITVRFD